MPELSVIIVNWNGKRYLKECIDSLLVQTYKKFNIIVVDNNSTDGSSELIEKDYSAVILIRLQNNKGFAAPNNIGIKKAIEKKGIKYIVLLNNDTVCKKTFIEEMVYTSQLDDSIGMVACKMLFFTRPQYINNAGGMIRDNGCFDGIGFNEKDGGRFDTLQEVFAPSGGAALYKTSMLKDIQKGEEFFDESFFAYHEDIDIAWRARLKKWKCYYNPMAVVLHHHSATFGNSSKKRYLCIRNNLYCLYKCLPVAVFKKVWWKIFLYHCKIAAKCVVLFDFYAMRGLMEGIAGSFRLKKKRDWIQNKIVISDDEMERMWGSSGWPVELSD